MRVSDGEAGGLAVSRAIGDKRFSRVGVSSDPIIKVTDLYLDTYQKFNESDPSVMVPGISP